MGLQEVKTIEKAEDRGCFNLPVSIYGIYIGGALCDLVINDTKLASVLTYIEVIKLIRFVSIGTVSTSTR